MINANQESAGFPVPALPLVWRYVIPPAATLATYVLQSRVLPHTSIAPFVFFYTAVALSALLGGRVPGLLAVVLSAAIANYAFVDGVGWSLSIDEVTATGLFLIAGTIVALLCAAFRSSALRAVENEERLRAIFENVTLGIVEVDTAGRIENANQLFCGMLGYRCGELRGKHVSDVTAPADRARSNELNDRLFRGEIDHYDHEKRYLTKSGAPVWVHVRVSTVRGAGETILRAVGTVEDISARKRAEEAVRASEEKYRMLFESIDEGFCVIEVLFDESGRAVDYTFLETNAAFERQTGIMNARGRRMREIAPGNEEHWFETYGRVALTGEPQRFENAAQALGRVFHVSAFRVGAPELRHVAILFNDITGVRKAQEEQQRLLQALREADQQKNEFLGVLSHELRNPLTPIGNSLYILERSRPGGEQFNRAILVIERQVAHMTRLIDDLLDVTRVSRGKIRLERETLLLNDLVHGIGDDFRELFRRHGVDFAVLVTGEPLYAFADRTRIAQVVGNLLQNAAKFTPPGGRVTLSLEPNGEGEAVIGVRDNGIGVEPSLLPRLFEPFVQAEATLSRADGGLGLGLALVKGLVELHGGRVTAQSHGPGSGAAFLVSLPLEKTDARRPPASRAQPRAVTSRGSSRWPREA